MSNIEGREKKQKLIREETLSRMEETGIPPSIPLAACFSNAKCQQIADEFDHSNKYIIEMVKGKLQKVEFGFWYFLISYILVFLAGVSSFIIGLYIFLSSKIQYSQTTLGLGITTAGIILILIALSKNPLKQWMLYKENLLEISLILNSYSNGSYAIFKNILGLKDITPHLEELLEKQSTLSLETLEKIRESFDVYENSI